MGQFYVLPPETENRVIIYYFVDTRRTTKRDALPQRFEFNTPNWTVKILLYS